MTQSEGFGRARPAARLDRRSTAYMDVQHGARREGHALANAPLKLLVSAAMWWMAEWAG